jgi:rhodanese-related sulfurtransferase
MSITNMSPAEFHRGWEEGRKPRVLDVRTPSEFESIHIPQAELCPLANLDESTIQNLKLPETVAVICKAGGRSAKAAQLLDAAGVKNVINITGGTDAWAAANLPVVRGESTGLSLQRQTQLGIGLIVLAGSLLALFVDIRFAVIPAFFGAGLSMAGLTGWCGFALLLARMPWNKAKACGKSCSV